MASYPAGELALEKGMIGIGPMPGRVRGYQADLTALLRWPADLVLSLTAEEELEMAGAGQIGDDLALAGVGWRHLPIANFGAPGPEHAALWAEASREAHRVLRAGGKVFAHCWAGCGRSGMALMRLMCEAGEAPGAALARLRAVRPCAVEMPAQQAWAAAGYTASP